MVRQFLIVEAALVHGTCTADDALLPGEDRGRRQGNPKIVGAAVAMAARCGWIAPAPAPPGTRRAVKSRRRTRARSTIEVWVRTPATAAAYEWLRSRITDRPAPQSLFDTIP